MMGPDILPTPKKTNKKRKVCANLGVLRDNTSATVNVRRPNLGFQLDPVRPLGCDPGGLYTDMLKTGITGRPKQIPT